MPVVRLNLRRSQRLLRDLRAELEPRFAQVLAGPNVQEVFLDFPTGLVRVVVRKRVGGADERLIGATVACAGRLLRPSVARWRTSVRRPLPYPFAVHGVHIPQQFLAEPLAPTFVIFDVLEEELVAMRAALTEITALLPRYDRVVSFASGGQPLIAYLSGPCHTIRDMALAKRRFHLFAGLNWGRDPHAQQRAFCRWIARSINRRILLLDTGTSGTTIRETCRLVRQTLSSSSAAAVTGEIQIVGLVDGHNDDQVPVDEIVVTAGGAVVRLSLRYMHIPRVFTEDCVALLGYNRLRADLSEQPVRQPGMFRVIGQPGWVGDPPARRVLPHVPRSARRLRRWSAWLLTRLTPVHVVSSDAASQALSSLLERPERHVLRERWYPREVQLGAALMIVSNMASREVEELNSLAEWGLLTRDEADAVREVASQHYASFAVRFPAEFWDWEGKKLVRGRARTTFWGDDAEG